MGGIFGLVNADICFLASNEKSIWNSALNCFSIASTLLTIEILKHISI
jgi:hypothetical protein